MVMAIKLMFVGVNDGSFQRTSPKGRVEPNVRGTHRWHQTIWSIDASLARALVHVVTVDTKQGRLNAGFLKNLVVRTCSNTGIAHSVL